MRIKTIKCLTFLLLGLSLSLSAQRTITGTVTDESGEVLIGATVMEAGTDNGTATDVDGTYSLKLSKDDAVLTFTYAGFASKQLDIGASNIIDAELSMSTFGLDEVVVVGYGTQLRSKITGNVSTVSGKDIEGTPVTSLESALQGRAPGVFISQQNGKTGSDINIRVRGAASINASNEPLKVIDGIVMSGFLSDLNFNEIESVEILKDASAAAIYGSRASNGVILITTKKGKPGKPQFSLDFSKGFSNPTRKRDWLNAAQYLELWDEAFDNVADADGLVFGDDADWWKNTFIPGWDGGHDVDWQEQAFNPDAGITQVQLDVSGGSDKTRYYISGGMFDQAGIMIYDNFQRLSGRLNLTHDASERVNLGMNMNILRTENDRLPGDNGFATPLQMIAQPPVQPLYDPDTIYIAGAYPLFYLQLIIETLSSDKNVQTLIITDACRAGKLAGSEIGGTQATSANLAKQYANEITGNLYNQYFNVLFHYMDNPIESKKYYQKVGFGLHWACLELMRTNQYEKADQAWKELKANYSSNSWSDLRYNYAQMKIRQGEADLALQLLDGIFAEGVYVCYELHKNDSELDPIRDTEEFKAMMRKYFPEKVNH